jgi:hypothetical protein
VGTRRVLLVLTILVPLALGAGVLVPVAAAPPPKPVPPRPTLPPHDPRKPGNHAAQDAWYYSQRLTANGTISGAARVAALRQAQTVPKTQTLPAAIGGKGSPVRDGLAPPSAVWQPLGPAPWTPAP